MKRIIYIAVAMILAVTVLCSCSQKQVDIKQVFDDVNSNYITADLKTVDDVSKLKRYYQIEEADVKSFAAEFSTQSSVFTEVVIVEATDDESAKRIVDALNTHYESRLSEGKSYNPEAVTMLNKCGVRQNGVYVDLVIADNVEDILSCIDSYIK